MNNSNIAKPFLKWAGGKTQIIPFIQNKLPSDIFSKKFTYIEPFVGSGAMLFWMLSNFPNIKKAVINDINTDLINTYQVIATSPEKLISILKNLQKEYQELIHYPEKRKEYFYTKRAEYNSRKNELCPQAALFIFLNKTCYNGLYRVNKKNFFNVPIGSYKKPLICDEPNILAISKVLKKTKILCKDFEKTLEFATQNTFFYFDPPYKPLNTTSSFNSYAQNAFDDSEQLRLRNFCQKLNQKGHKWILSNSDVKSKNNNRGFFDELYKDFKISRVNARRSINSKGNKRGKLTELLITNYNNYKPIKKQIQL